MIRLLTPKTTYTMDYPEAIKYAERQAGIFWLPDEIHVEKDLHELKTNFSDAEYHGVVSTLKLFTLYELSVGGDYWQNYICKIFKRPDIQRMATTFSFFELGVHAPFYNKINEILGLDTDEFYNSYLDDPVLKNRMGWIGKRVSKSDTPFDILKSIGIFSMIEGAILYSSFAYLKHFNNVGKNKLTTINAGINFSINDEQLHSEAGAWLFRVLLNETINDSQLSEDKLDELKSELYETAKVILEHETNIIGKIFERGKIPGISDIQLIHFVQSRLDICLNNLGFKSIFKPSYNPIAEWVYKDIDGSTLHDFFNNIGNEYSRSWRETEFVW